MKLLIDLVESLYAISGPLAFLAYFPQILALLKNKDGAHSTSLLTWLMWALALGINTAYAGLVNGDLYFLISSASGFAGSVLVFVIACYKRSRFPQAQSSTC